MSGRYLLDTNIIIAALASDASVLARIDDADECFISIVVLGEMLYGAFNSNNVDSNLHRLRVFGDQVGALPCDEVTAELYGQIKTSLRRQGTPIPENDIWIAASALQHSLTLVTRDVHFDAVKSLQRARW
jgi:tRNA(fMet)-specific endonuclease VapC